MIDPWEVLEVEYIVDNKWIRFSSRKFRLPNGAIIPDYYIVEKPDVALVVPITPEGRTMIMKEFERGVMEVGYKFPAGRVKMGEPPAEAAKREFLEETGIAIDKFVPVGVLDSDPGWLTTKVHVFVADTPEIEAQPEPNPEELFLTEWIDFQFLGKLINEGSVHNIFVVAAYQLANAYINARVT